MKILIPGGSSNMLSIKTFINNLEYDSESGTYGHYDEQTVIINTQEVPGSPGAAIGGEWIQVQSFESEMGSVDLRDLNITRNNAQANGSGGLPSWTSDVNAGVGAFGLGVYTQTELLDYAVRNNYKSATSWSDFNKLRETQKAWRTTNTLGKTGTKYLNGAKVLGKAVFAVTVVNSGLNAGNAFMNDDPNKWGVAGKAGLDVAMGYVGFLGPIGFGISAGYFILDAAGAFNSWSQPVKK